MTLNEHETRKILAERRLRQAQAELVAAEYALRRATEDYNAALMQAWQDASHSTGAR